MYKSIDLKQKASVLEAEIRRHWDENSLAKKSEDFREGSPKFIFYEGPPTANGKPGIHHVMARTLKDVVCRYKTMTGFREAQADGTRIPSGMRKAAGPGRWCRGRIWLGEVLQQCRASVFSYESCGAR